MTTKLKVLISAVFVLGFCLGLSALGGIPLGYENQALVLGFVIWFGPPSAGFIAQGRKGRNRKGDYSPTALVLAYTLGLTAGLFGCFPAMAFGARGVLLILMLSLALFAGVSYFAEILCGGRRVAT